MDPQGIAILLQFLPIEPYFVRTGCDRHFKIAILLQHFHDRTSFRTKRLQPEVPKSQFYLSFSRSNLISCERVAFPGASLALQERNRKEGERRGQEGERARGPEGKRARGQESKRARGPEGKKARGQESKREREGKRAREQHEGKRARG